MCAWAFLLAAAFFLWCAVVVVGSVWALRWCAWRFGKKTP